MIVESVLLGAYIAFIVLGASIEVGFILGDGLNPFESKRYFWGTVGFYQGAIWINAKEKLNVAGQILVQIIAAPLTIPISILMLALLFVCEVVRLFIWIFMLLFGKKEANGK